MVDGSDTEDDGIDPYLACYEEIRARVEHAEDMLRMHDNGRLREMLLDDLEHGVDQAVAIMNRMEAEQADREAAQALRETEASLMRIEAQIHTHEMQTMVESELEAKVSELERSRGVR
jgi:hypothetical protein